jgi:hypothetical protein
MFLSAVSVLVAEQPILEFPEGLMNYPVFIITAYVVLYKMIICSNPCHLCSTSEHFFTTISYKLYNALCDSTGMYKFLNEVSVSPCCGSINTCTFPIWETGCPQSPVILRSISLFAPNLSRQYGYWPLAKGIWGHLRATTVTILQQGLSSRVNKLAVRTLAMTAT